MFMICRYRLRGNKEISHVQIRQWLEDKTGAVLDGTRTCDPKCLLYQSYQVILHVYTCKPVHQVCTMRCEILAQPAELPW